MVTAGATLSALDELESESIYILREVAAQFERPVILYSVGKDSSVLLRLAQKAFAPMKIPIPFLHVDTGFKFPEMYEFRAQVEKETGIRLHIFKNQPAINAKTNPWILGTQKCCGLLKTQGLLGGLKEFGFQAAIGAARRDEEKSRAKERIFSFRDIHGQWNPKNQRPELWNHLNGMIGDGESMRVFPMSNWTEHDIWRYIQRESISVVPLYFAKKRPVIRRGSQWIPYYEGLPIRDGEEIETREVRFRTLGCFPCTGAVESSASTVDEIVEEMKTLNFSERITRVIDFDGVASMEAKKREGYF